MAQFIFFNKNSSCESVVMHVCVGACMGACVLETQFYVVLVWLLEQIAVPPYPCDIHRLLASERVDLTGSNILTFPETCEGVEFFILSRSSRYGSSQDP